MFIIVAVKGWSRYFDYLEDVAYGCERRRQPINDDYDMTNMHMTRAQYCSNDRFLPRDDVAKAPRFVWKSEVAPQAK